MDQPSPVNISGAPDRRQLMSSMAASTTLSLPFGFLLLFTEF